MATVLFEICPLLPNVFNWVLRASGVMVEEAFAAQAVALHRRSASVGVCRSEGEEVSTGSQDGKQRGASGAWRSRGGGEAGGALVCQPRLHGGGGRDVQSRGKGGEDWGQVTGANPAGGSEVVEQGGRLRMGRLDVSLPFPSEAQHREVPDEREGGLPDVGHHVHLQGSPRWKAPLPRLPDQACQRSPQESLVLCRVFLSYVINCPPRYCWGSSQRYLYIIKLQQRDAATDKASRVDIGYGKAGGTAHILTQFR